MGIRNSLGIFMLHLFSKVETPSELISRQLLWEWNFQEIQSNYSNIGRRLHDWSHHLNTPNIFIKIQLTLTKANTHNIDYNKHLRSHSKFDGMLRLDINICISNNIKSRNANRHSKFLSKNLFIYPLRNFFDASAE